MGRSQSLTLLLLAGGGCFSPEHADGVTLGPAESSSGGSATTEPGDDSGSDEHHGSGPASTSASEGDSSGTGETGSSSADTSSEAGSDSTGEPSAICGDGVVVPGELCFDDITLVDGFDVVYSGRLADVDLDGDTDVVYLIGDGVVIHQGTGDGSFGPALGGGTMVCVNAEVGDIDGDGVADLAGVNDYDATLQLALGDGEGTMVVQDNPITTTAGPYELLVADLDGAAGDEIVIGTDSSVQVFRSDGDATPVEADGFGLGGPVHALGLGELDGDGDADLFYVYEAYGEQRLNARLGNGDGSFGSLILIDDAGDMPRGVAGGDLDGDGHGDLVHVDVELAEVYVLLGNGAGGFADPLAVATDDDPRHTLVLDVTADGVVDVVVGHGSSHSLWVYAGDGSGGLAAPLMIPLAGPVDSLAWGFANADPVPDLVTTDGNAQRISIVLSTP
jgi:FG-GAP-like repeat